MCSSVWSRSSPVFSWKFVCYLHPLQHDSTWKQTVHSKVFSKNRMVMRNPKKNLRKESWEKTSRTTKWDKLGQVGARGTNGTRRRGSSDLSWTSGPKCLQIFVGRVGQGQGVCPLEPFLLSQMGLQGRVKFHFACS